MKTMRLIIGISGATGSIYGIRLLEILKEKKIETHLVVSSTSEEIIPQETPYSVKEIERLASYVYEYEDLHASIASGSFHTDGMIVIPCSMRTLSGIAHSYNENLLIRAADVTLKERRKLVLVVRETPFHLGHLELMLQAARIGAILYPPVPAFYFKPKTIDDLVKHTVGKVLDLFRVDHHLFERWEGPKSAKEEKRSSRKKRV
jgi:4-hydroxy-3-polyprenylbenzoate decarboxylase